MWSNRVRAKFSQFISMHPHICVIVAAFVVVATIYSIATPIFEAGDEIWHYPFVQHLATGHSLPIQDPAVKTRWEQEGGQPPLYYALGAAMTFWVDTGDLADRLWVNPHAKIGIPLVHGNKNLIVHTGAEDFPWHNTTLAVHLLRLLSIALSAGTVALTYALALAIKPDKGLAALAAAFVAFNPMFLFISASVNNDNLAVVIATLALLLIVRLFRSATSLRDYIFLGLVLGMGALTKASDLGLIVIAGCVFVYLMWREWRAGRRDRLVSVVTGSLMCAGIVVLVAAWWYVRNYLLYADPLAFNVWVAIAGARPVPATMVSLFGEIEGFIISFWGNFGGVNIIAPGWVYNLLNVVTLLAIVGLVFGLVRRRLPPLLSLLALWLVLIGASLIRWTLLTLASQGRLIFPAIAAVAILLAFGLDQLTPAHWRAPIRRLVNLQIPMLVFVFSFAALAPFALIAPAYALPSRLADDSLVPNKTHIVFEDQAELVGYALPVKSVAPGSELPLTLYWRGQNLMYEDYSVYIHLFDSSGNSIGQWDAYPGGGLYPTRLWLPGQVIVDSYSVPITATAKGPSVGRVEAGLYRRSSLKNLVARDPQNRIITPTLAQFKVTGQSRVQVENPVKHDFDRKIALVGYSLQNAPGSLRTRLYWRAEAAIEEDYSVFVHLLDASGNLIAQKDGQPQHGTYPTHFWDAGETIADDYVLDLPPNLSLGDCKIEVGLYWSDGTRLMLPEGGDSVIITSVPVGR